MSELLWKEFCGGDLWVNGVPNLSICFQHTVLVWIPVSFFWILLPFLLIQAKFTSGQYVTLPWSAHLVLKMVNAYLALAMALLFSRSPYPTSDVLYPILWTITFLCVTYTHLLRKQSGMVTSGILHLSAICFSVCGAPQFYQYIREGNEVSLKTMFTLQFYSLLFLPLDPSNLSSPLCIAYFIWYISVLIYTFLMFFADPRDPFHKANVELDSSFFNRLTLWWFNPIPWKGARKDLEPEDLFDLNERSTTKCLSDLWEMIFLLLSDFLFSSGEPSGPSVVACLFAMFRWEFLTATILKVISDILQFANPFLLHQLIGFVSDPKAPLWIGLAYAVLMFTASEVRSFILNSYFYIMFRMGVKFQTALTAAIYKKTLNLSNSARRDKTVGEIVNLMAIDVERFQLITPQIQQFWSCPFQITLGLIFLFFTLGYSAAPGVIVMIIFLPSNIISSVIVKKWQVAQMKLKDERTKMINELLNGIKVVKLYAWEIPMEEHINDIRRREIKLLKKSYIVRNIMDSFNTACPFLVALFSFGTYVLSSSSHELTPQIAFVSLTLFNQLRSPMVMITLLINQLVQVIIVIFNIASTSLPRNLTQQLSTWNDTGPATLKDIDLNVVSGSLIAVVGKVGAGKSSLLSALLGEMEKLRGKITIHGKLAYISQLPWIQNMTVRDNILFGKPFDRRKYNEVLSACALKPDLKILPYGDKTEIGEKGVNLSGGQKARLSLARAVYQDCDVYLLDDPLSAVDAHVGRHIFEKVLGPDGLLREKTRILVTHRLSYLKSADEIVVLQDGIIIESGTYSVLMNQRGMFYRFVEEHKSNSENEENDDESASNDLNGGLENGVKMSVYFLYMKAASYWKSFLFILFLCGYQLIQILRSFWLSAWSDENDGYHENKMAVGWRLTVYGFLGTAEALSFLLSLIYLSFAGLAAAYNLHAPLINNLLRSPMSFYDTTPLGRILNRCSKDVETVDMLLPTNFRYLGTCVLQVLFTVIVIVISTPIFSIVILPLVIIYYFFLKFYVPTSRQLKRLESIHRSPIFSHFGETIQGAASIRAFGKVEEFQTGSGKIVDEFIRCKYSNIVANRWLGIRLEFIGNLVVNFFRGLLRIWLGHKSRYNWCIHLLRIKCEFNFITEVLNFAVRQISEIEANIVAVERIEEYTNTPTEAPWDVPENKPPAKWPSHGAVDFVDYSTRYREGLDLVLKGISASVKEGEKVGIVGRTGAGKSSFTLALFRMIEPVSGKIIVDKVDIANIGLHVLRSNLTIIPQDPILFSGSLRFNLDPFERNNDDEIWRSLELSHLKDFVSGLQGGLNYSISEGGENISVGQRQLVCLARAILRNSRILVLDEATAAVDVETDALIQGTIREYFRNCTVFTIAHRLNTIMDYDRVMVLKNGRIIEFDSPKALLCNRNSTFARMVEESKSESKRA
uniref:ABC-type glutathione-S-conjugate transporter n=1 Tax=Angiostrongylus cantonensis TaxID=6313 RepID=A0A158PA92_ANGCA